MKKFQKNLESLIILLIDLVTMVVIYQASVLLRKHFLPFFYSGFPPLILNSSENLWWILFMWAFFFAHEGTYTKTYSLWDETRALWKATFFAIVTIFTFVSIGKLSDEISRTIIILMGVIGILFFPAERIIAKKACRRIGLFKRRVLVLGAGEAGQLIARVLKKDLKYNYRVVGYLDDDSGKIGKTIEGIKVHRGVDSALRYIKYGNITDLIIAMPGAGKERIQELMDNLQHRVERILLMPDIFDISIMGSGLQHFIQEQAFAIEMENNLAKPFNYLTKRLFDYIIVSILLLMLALPMLIIAVIIKATSKGPVIFRHERLGKGGRPFMCCKFRTMYIDAEERLSDILKSDPRAKEEWSKCWKLKNDPRVTKIGRILRRTSLDELPQIFNVLGGRMSLVGPRPVVKEEIDKYYKDKAELYYYVLPGITGLWQISGRSNTSYDYRIALDSWYVRNWKLWLDVMIMLKTVQVVFRKDGAC